MHAARSPIEDEVVARITRLGPLPFSEVMELALYDAEHGFYAKGGRAGRRGDFITSPEVGPLFGAVLARYLDDRWHELGKPDPFMVIEGGAGVGTLARSVLAAAPLCLPALTYLLVERSAPLRQRHGDHLEITLPAFALPPPFDGDDQSDRGASVGVGSGEGVSTAGRGPRFVPLSDLPALKFTGVVLANELLDNLAFDVLVRHEHTWREVRVGWDDERGSLVEFVVPAAEAMVERAERWAPHAPDGARLPVQTGAAEWVARALDLIDHGALVIIDYAADSATLAERPAGGWLRTYRSHESGGHPLADLGTQDITAEVAEDQLGAVRKPARIIDQAAFLREAGIDELVEDGRRIWRERAAIGDLVAIAARSRIGEAEALLDAQGLGAFKVFEWRVAP